MIGNEIEVLFEHENHNSFMKGFSSNYVRVTHPHDSSYTNIIFPVKITAMDNGICAGEIVDTKKAVDLITT
jgi:hypothetical protein